MAKFVVLCIAWMNTSVFELRHRPGEITAWLVMQKIMIYN